MTMETPATTIRTETMSLGTFRGLVHDWLLHVPNFVTWKLEGLPDDTSIHVHWEGLGGIHSVKVMGTPTYTHNRGDEHAPLFRAVQTSGITRPNRAFDVEGILVYAQNLEAAEAIYNDMAGEFL